MLRATKIEKSYGNLPVLKGIDLEISKGEKIAITGQNGSGKSTFLQLLSGYISPTEGTVQWVSDNGPIPAENIHRFISFASPYLELIEEFTLEENVSFFSRYKKFQQGISTQLLIETAGLVDARSKQIKNFSSGMKQRCKLALAFMADTPLLLIDEPLSNLDAAGSEWYRNLVAGLDASRTVVICSNQVREETFFCERSVSIEDFKQA